MKTLWLSLALLAAGFLQAQENKAAALFQKGNAAYQAERYDSALVWYQQIPAEQNLESAALHYNLGNTYYKLGNLGRAILHYERALKLKPNDEDTQQNLTIAHEKTVDRFEELPKTLVRTAYLGLLQLLSPKGWAILSLLGLGLLVLGLALYLYSRLGRVGFSTAAAGLLLGIVSLVLAFSHQHYLKNNQGAIVLSTSAYVKSGPSETAEDVLILHEGTKATVLQSFEGWRKIRLPDGKLGWIPAEDLELI